MTMKGYKICFATDTITVTKKFMEDASVINSAAFKEMMALRKLGMAIVVREVKLRKKNTITYNATAQTTAVSGVVDCQLKLIGADGGIISTPRFSIIVGDTLYNEGEFIGSTDEFNVLTNLIAELNDKFTSISTITLRSANWVGSSSPYSQVVTIDGVTENSRVDINPSVEQLATFHSKDITFVTENVGGVITVYCIGQKPANDYTVQVTITEVENNV